MGKKDTRTPQERREDRKRLSEILEQFTEPPPTKLPVSFSEQQKSPEYLDFFIVSRPMSLFGNRRQLQYKNTD